MTREMKKDSEHTFEGMEEERYSWFYVSAKIDFKLSQYDEFQSVFADFFVMKMVIENPETDNCVGGPPADDYRCRFAIGLD